MSIKTEIAEGFAKLSTRLFGKSEKVLAEEAAQALKAAQEAENAARLARNTRMTPDEAANYLKTVKETGQTAAETEAKKAAEAAAKKEADDLAAKKVAETTTEKAGVNAAENAQKQSWNEARQTVASKGARMDATASTWLASKFSNPLLSSAAYYASRPLTWLAVGQGTMTGIGARAFLGYQGATRGTNILNEGGEVGADAVGVASTTLKAGASTVLWAADVTNSETVRSAGNWLLDKSLQTGAKAMSFTSEVIGGAYQEATTDTPLHTEGNPLNSVAGLTRSGRRLDTIHRAQDKLEGKTEAASVPAATTAAATPDKPVATTTEAQTGHDGMTPAQRVLHAKEEAAEKAKAVAAAAADSGAMEKVKELAAKGGIPAILGALMGVDKDKGLVKSLPMMGLFATLFTMLWDKVKESGMMGSGYNHRSNNTYADMNTAMRTYGENHADAKAPAAPAVTAPQAQPTITTAPAANDAQYSAGLKKSFDAQAALPPPAPEVDKTTTTYAFSGAAGLPKPGIQVIAAPAAPATNDPHYRQYAVASPSMM